jgi:hypothetical protein
VHDRETIDELKSSLGLCSPKVLVNQHGIVC